MYLCIDYRKFFHHVISFLGLTEYGANRGLGLLF